ncbi:MAG: glycosyltransferase, partial [Phycisphaerales bacterium]|nr:glycosyltransferase [Phycisphaerales bacterium]
MRWLGDAAYLGGAILTSPVWLPRMLVTGKIRTDWPARFGRGDTIVATDRPRILLHAVSVGEVNAIRALVRALDERGIDVVIATTTDTGTDRARAIFGGRHPVVRYPFDFSGAVARFLDRVRPDAVGLVELEVWPAFTRACADRRVPIAVVNGRLSRRSADRYRWIRFLVRPSFRRLAFAAVQTESDATRFEAMGVPRERIEVTGTMKWDTASIADSVEGADA